MKTIDLFTAQKKYFNTQTTYSVDYRKQQLLRLKLLLRKNEEALFEALYLDFGKNKFDTYLTELSMIYQEIDFFVKHLSRLARPTKVRTALPSLPGSTKIYKDPLGVVLVIGAWNYPYQLSLIPMLTAMAAGNTCILKPSELPRNTSQILAKLINTHFPNEYLYVVEGGVDSTTELLQLRFDKIFFTGSTQVGKIVYQAAAKNLVPVVLELGGKSPAIVSASASIEIAVRRIVWGKFLNAGQTCVAPDYVYVHNSKKDAFIASLIQKLKEINYHEEAAHYTRIINEKNFDRLVALLHAPQVVYGGSYNKKLLYIEPTLLFVSDWDDPLMQEELFGPLLPILFYEDFQKVIATIRSKEKPLSAYLFSQNALEQKQFVENLSFGGGCINDTLMHLTSERIPFGGVGNSGMGSYHGSFGFDAFTHQKPVVKKALWGEPSLKYPPYTTSKWNWIKRLF